MPENKKRKFIRKGNFFVYILQCLDGSYYTGQTNDLERRIKQHNEGKGAWYTKVKGAGELVWRKEYRCFRPAFLMEKRIKRLTRKEKETLVKGRNLLSVLAEAGK
jgi:putative endonuclease